MLADSNATMWAGFAGDDPVFVNLDELIAEKHLDFLRDGSPGEIAGDLVLELDHSAADTDT